MFDNLFFLLFFRPFGLILNQTNFIEKTIKTIKEKENENFTRKP